MCGSHDKNRAYDNVPVCPNHTNSDSDWIMSGYVPGKHDFQVSKFSSWLVSLQMKIDCQLDWKLAVMCWHALGSYSQAYCSGDSLFLFCIIRIVGYDWCLSIQSSYSVFSTCSKNAVIHKQWEIPVTPARSLINHAVVDWKSCAF